MKAYLIPGWGESLKDRDYNAVLNVYKQAGYDPEFIKIDWNYKVIEDWLAEVKAKISKRDLQSSLLSGFSFGAMTAMSVAADYQNPRQLFIFSLSPYYDADRPKESWLKAIGKRRAESFKKIDFEDLTSRIKCPVSIFYGSEESAGVRRRAEAAHKSIANSNLVCVKGAPHDAAHPKYVAAINEQLKLAVSFS